MANWDEWKTWRQQRREHEKTFRFFYGYLKTPNRFTFIASKETSWCSIIRNRWQTKTSRERWFSTSILSISKSILIYIFCQNMSPTSLNTLTSQLSSFSVDMFTGFHFTCEKLLNISASKRKIFADWWNENTEYSKMLKNSNENFFVRKEKAIRQLVMRNQSKTNAKCMWKWSFHVFRHQTKRRREQ